MICLHRTAAIKDRIRRDQRRDPVIESNLLSTKAQKAAWLWIVIKAPEGAVHIGMIPIVERWLIAAFMDQKGRPTCLSDGSDIHAPRGGVVQIFAVCCHGE